MYYKRGSQKKKVLRLDDLIKFPVEQPADTDSDDDQGDVYNRVQAKRAHPIRLLSNDAAMVELYNRLVRLSHSSALDSRKRSGGDSESYTTSDSSTSIEELRRSIASQELLLSQIRQSLVTP